MDAELLAEVDRRIDEKLDARMTDVELALRAIAESNKAIESALDALGRANQAIAKALRTG